MSIKYDSTELQAAAYTPRFVKHETSPARLVNSLKLARQDGEVIVDDTMAVKYIDISGILTGSSQSDLESKIDAFKELIARKDKNLDIDWNGGTRRYVCRSLTHSFDRDFYNILYVPYSVKFLVTTGYGTDTSETTALDKSGIVATTDSEAITFAGSYQPKPRHKITITTRGNADVVRVENTDSGDYMEVDLDGFNNGDWFEINEENQTVKKGGVANLAYRGKFPSSTAGLTNLKITLYGSGNPLDQSQQLTYSNNVMGDSVSSPQQAQSFVPTQSGRIQYLSLYLSKTTNGGLGGSLYVYISPDDNGKPAATYLGARYEITAAGIASGSGQWNGLTFSSTDANKPFLTKGKKYWIVAKPATLTGIDASNFVSWFYKNDPLSYVNGKALSRKSSGDPWLDGISNAQATSGIIAGAYDMAFIEYRGSDGGAASHSVRWEIYYTKKYL
jgi:hypothetical protein